MASDRSILARETEALACKGAILAALLLAQRLEHPQLIDVLTTAYQEAVALVDRFQNMDDVCPTTPQMHDIPG